MRLWLILGLTVLVVGGIGFGIGLRGADAPVEPLTVPFEAERLGEKSDLVARGPSARMTPASQPETFIPRAGIEGLEAEPALARVDRPAATLTAPAPTPASPSESSELADAAPTLKTISPLELEERWSGYNYDYVREIWAYVDGEIKVFGSRGGGFRALHAQLREDLVRSEPWSGPLPEPQLRFTVIDGSGRTRELSVGEWWISDGQRLSALDEARAQQYRALMAWRLGVPGDATQEDFDVRLAARAEAYRQRRVSPGGLDPRPHAPMPTLATAP